MPLTLRSAARPVARHSVPVENVSQPGTQFSITRQPCSTTAGHSADPAVLAKMSAGHDATISAESSSVIPSDYSDAKKTTLNATVDPKGKNEFTFEIK